MEILATNTASSLPSGSTEKLSADSRLVSFQNADSLRFGESAHNALHRAFPSSGQNMTIGRQSSCLGGGVPAQEVWRMTEMQSCHRKATAHGFGFMTLFDYA
jgi:hypothetical protein